MGTASQFARATLLMISGLLIWAAHFALIYAFTALACARRFWELSWLGVAVVPWLVGFATVAAVGALLAIGARSLRQAHSKTGVANASQFCRWMTVAIAWLAVLAIVWQVLPVLLVPTCA